MGRPTVIKIGAKHGRLIVKEILPGGAGKNAVAVCECECGNFTKVRSQLLKKIKSCGCSQHLPEFRKPRGKNTYPALAHGEAAMNALYSAARGAAVRNGRIFELTKEQFRKIVTKPCSYCGAAPVEKPFTKADGSQMYNGSAFANGIDRIDNTEGYIIGNVAACCTSCNLSKHTRTKNQFLTHAFEVVKKQLSNSKFRKKFLSDLIAAAGLDTTPE